jgi:hypothetical protein
MNRVISVILSVGLPALKPAQASYYCLGKLNPELMSVYVRQTQEKAMQVSKQTNTRHFNGSTEIPQQLVPDSIHYNTILPY